MTLRPLVLCADDFAISPSVSRAIIALLEQGRLSATSCMAVRPGWAEHARWLSPFAGIADVGLHFTLTAVKPLSRQMRLAKDGRLPSLGALMAQTYLRKLDLDEVATELERQMDAFERGWGAPPDFVDGHQHVHLLPGVREIVLDIVASRAPNAYVRQCGDSLVWILRRRVAIARAIFIANLSRPLGRLLRSRRTNDSFRGVTSFSMHARYPEQFRRYLLGPGAKPLIMCHPGKVDSELPDLDSVTYQREQELAYFMGTAFPEDLNRAGYRLSRME